MSIPRLTLYSEPFAPTGSISGRGLRKLLGAPTLDTLQTAVREAVQNSCDASRLGAGPEILFRLRTLTEEQRRTLKTCVFPTLPSATGSRDPLQDFLDSDSPQVMEICDFGSTGLGGPTRADRIPVDSESTDFIDFMRNVGIDRNTMHGGGTYGYGKVSLYRASKCSTIVVDTRTTDGGDASRRVMACHLGEKFEERENRSVRRYTGRHWWGVRARDGHVDPVQGDGAEALAEAIGFPRRGKRKTGTSIMIIDPATDGGDLRTEASRILETLLWNFWPRMMEELGPERQIKFHVEVERQVLPVPRPEDFPPLDLFCRAMSAVRNNGDEARLIRSERPKKDLGRIATVRGVRNARTPIVAEDSVMPGRTAHIALMRPVELIVRYIEGDPLVDERLEWAGVFRTNEDAEVEHAFATAEPPAHDDWVPDSLPKGRERTMVKVAMKEIKRISREVAAADGATPPREGPDTPLARLSGHLGRLLTGVFGEGAGPGRAKGPRGAFQRRANVASRPEFLRLEKGATGPVAVFATEVKQDGRRKSFVLKAEATYALEGGSLPPEPGEAEAIPEVLSIATDDETVLFRGDSAPLNGRQGVFLIRVTVPPDRAVTVRVELTEE